MKKYMIHLNSGRCVACYGCTVHCKTNKGLGVGPTLCEVEVTPLRLAGGMPRLDISFVSCRHCETPLCVPVCPADAMVQREDGIVYVDAEKCIGCMACQRACPWQIPAQDPVSGKAVKCDLCMDRLAQGQKPACVSKCATHALHLVELVAA